MSTITDRTSTDTIMTKSTTPRPPVASTVLDLLDRSRASLLSACRTSSAGERFIDAHLGALRAAAALLAVRSLPASKSRLRSVWEVLPEIASDLGEWATFFAGSARRRAAIERGSITVGSREADDLLRQAEIFLELVQSVLGLPIGGPLPEFMTPTLPERRVPAARRPDPSTRAS